MPSTISKDTIEFIPRPGIAQDAAEATLEPRAALAATGLRARTDRRPLLVRPPRDLHDDHRLEGLRPDRHPPRSLSGEAIGFHVTLRLADDRPIATSVADLRVLARVVLEQGEARGLVAFGAADNHLHAMLVSDRVNAGAFAHYVETSLRWRLRLRVPFEGARTTSRRPATRLQHLPLRPSAGHAPRARSRPSTRRHELARSSRSPRLLHHDRAPCPRTSAAHRSLCAPRSPSDQRILGDVDRAAVTRSARGRGDRGLRDPRAARTHPRRASSASRGRARRRTERMQSGPLEPSRCRHARHPDAARGTGERRGRARREPASPLAGAPDRGTHLRLRVRVLYVEHGGDTGIRLR